MTCRRCSLTYPKISVVGTLVKCAVKTVVVGTVHGSRPELWGRSCEDRRGVPTTTVRLHNVSPGPWNVPTTTVFMALSLPLSYSVHASLSGNLQVLIYLFKPSAAKGASHLHAGKIKYNEHMHVKQWNKIEQLYDRDINEVTQWHCKITNSTYQVA